MKKLVRFLKLGRRQKLLLLQTYMLLSLVRICLLLLPYKWLQYLLNKISLLDGFHGDSISIQRIVRAIHSCSCFSPGKVKCLAKALTSNTLMNIYGLPSQLNIGVTLGENKKLEAHAWVEAEGSVVMGYLPDLSRFKVMTPIEEKIVT